MVSVTEYRFGFNASLRLDHYLLLDRTLYAVRRRPDCGHVPDAKYWLFSRSVAGVSRQSPFSLPAFHRGVPFLFKGIADKGPSHKAATAIELRPQLRCGYLLTAQFDGSLGQLRYRGTKFG